jgi:dihydropyrimidinase
MGRRSGPGLTVPFDLVIRGATVVTAREATTRDIAVRDGRVAALLHPGDGDAHELLDAHGLVALPGGIDTHTHVAWPYDGTFTVDDFRSAGRAAALSGTTTIIDFVPPSAPDGLYEACMKRIEQARSQGIPIDFAVHAILTSAASEVLRDIPRVVEAGVTSFKMYTTYEDRRIDDSDAWTLSKAIVAAGGMPGFHAENDEIVRHAESVHSHNGVHPLADFERSRPGLAEAEAIQMVAMYARKLSAPVWIYHVSGREALTAITEARALGTVIYAETCAHYLTLDESVYVGADAWRYVICPPLRSVSDQKALWSAIAAGEISAVGTDHCAYGLDDKSRSTSDYLDIPAGAPGIGARGPVFWHGAVNEQQLPLTTVAAAWAENAARAQGMFPRKGIIAVGSDADIALMDPEGRWEGANLPAVSTDTFSLYEGLRGTGTPRHVLSRGRFLVRDSEYCGDGVTGSFVVRPAR